MRQVRETVWIGDCLDAQDTDDLHQDVIISMVKDPQYNGGAEDYHFPIFDGPHEYDDFKEAAETFLEHYENGDTIFIHCQAGVSRSTSVATAAIAVAEESSWVAVLSDTAAGHAPVSFALMNSGKQFIAEKSAERGFEYSDDSYMELDDDS